MGKRLPKLCWHKPTQRWYVRVGGRCVYLGRDQETAEKERLRVLAEAASGPAVGANAATLNVLAASYLDHCQGYYRKPDGTPTSELTLVRLALRPLLELYGSSRTADFRPRHLEAYMQTLAETRCRISVNRDLGRIKRMFRWGVARELVPGDVLVALQAVEGYRAGRSPARERPKVGPAPEASIAAVRPLLCDQLRAMVDLQLLTGMRPGEVCRMRPADIDRQAGSGCWSYTPADHKTAYRGTTRIVPLGPQAQEILKPWLLMPSGKGVDSTDTLRPDDAYLFSPWEARLEFDRQRNLRRKTKADQRVRKPKGQGPKRPGPRYTPSSYEHAVRRACLRAGVEPFAPHRLRKNAADRLEREFGEKLAATILGHANPGTTRKFYLSLDLDAAFRAAAKVG